MQIGDIPIGDGAPLALFAGLNVLEAEAEAIECAGTLAAMSSRHGIPVIFKASFDKANRTRVGGHRGPGIDAGLRILASVRRATNLPVMTDVHEAGQAKIAAEVVDCLQVPAFLCRQTELIAACAATGRPVNVKKGQFIAPLEMRHVVEKLAHFGCQDTLVTERGATFGYNDLVSDMRSLVQMRAFAPVCFDATHAVQRPGADAGSSSGNREFVAPLARAATAAGIDALFVEVHPRPASAPVDAACQIDPSALDRLLDEVLAIDRALRSS